MMSDHIYVVILAGGSGTRFWPKSRHLTPKQLCAIGTADETMLQTTLKRLDGFVPVERRMIVTHRDQISGTRASVQDACPIILAEPEAKNTANALALAALEIKARHRGPKSPVMISLHADHVITKPDVFRECIQQGVAVAEKGFLTLMGIVPNYPETGYGYIEVGQPLSPGENVGFRVKSFREKPELKLAQQYLNTGNFLWNSGMFIWKVDTILNELKERLPVAVDKLSTLLNQSGGQSFFDVRPDDLAKTYGELPKIAIDNAVLEVSKNVAVIKADIGWQDVGSWNALNQCFSTDALGNYRQGDVMLIDTKNSTIDSDGPFVACIGLENMVVVAAKGAVLVCPQSRAQDVKMIVEQLKEQKRHTLI